jgi:hypothetical protein
MRLRASVTHTPHRVRLRFDYVPRRSPVHLASQIDDMPKRAEVCHQTCARKSLTEICVGVHRQALGRMVVAAVAGGW